jgi:hypothetical protein
MAVLIYFKMMLSLSIFSKYRFLIQMIVVCFYDMIPFLVLVILMTVSFSALHFVDPEFEKTFFEQVVGQYRILYGDNPDADHSISLVIFTIFSIFMSVLMLNLLIAIISDTFDK